MVRRLLVLLGFVSLCAPGLSAGNTVFRRPLTLSVPMAPPPINYLDTTAADIDGDGNIDVVSATPRLIAVHRGNGDGTFQPPVFNDVRLSSSGVGYPLVIGDLNGDGHADILTVDDRETLVAFYGGGDGTFSRGPSFTPDRNTTYAIGDVNADGVPDVIAAAIEPLRYVYRVWLGTGGGAFGAAISSTAANRCSIVLGDVDHDGKIDITDCNVVARGQGDGTFILPAVVPDVVFGDFSHDVNHDGTADYVAALGYGGPPCGTIRLRLGNGDGTFRDGSGVSMPSPSFGEITDYNGDGIVDLFVHIGLTGIVGFAAGHSDGTFEQPELYWVDDEALSIHLADFNNDGKLDVLFISGQPAVMLSTPSGYSAQRWYDSSDADGACAGQPVGVGDVNGDGKVDILTSPGLSYLPGNGDGTFGTVRTNPSGGSGAALAGDFNGDGRLDSAIEVADGRRIFLSNGDGTFREVSTLAPHAEYAGDFTGDGKTDLLHVDDASVTVYPATLDGVFGAGIVSSRGPETVGQIADVNRDGRADIVWTTLAISFAQMSGGFSAPTGNRIFGATAIAVGDLDNDGDIDAIAVSSFPELTPFVNRGDFSFTALPAIRLPPLPPPHRLVIADFDGDGRADTAINGLILFGDGSASFSHAFMFNRNGGAKWAAAADLDGNGLPDLILSPSFSPVDGTAVIRAIPAESREIPLTVSIATDLTYAPSVIFNATVTSTTPYAPTNVVRFAADGKVFAFAEVRFGVAVGSVDRLPANDPQITAAYGADGIFASTIAALSKKPAALSWRPPTSDVVAASPFDMTLTLARADGGPMVGPSGSVAVLVDGTLSTTISAQPSMTFRSTYTAGDHHLEARYDGDCCLEAGIATYELVVKKAAPVVTLTPSATSVRSGDSLTLTATLDHAEATGTITFKDAGSLVGTVPLSNGRATYSIVTVAGAHTYTADYSGDTNLGPATSQIATVNVSAGTDNAFAIQAEYASGVVRVLWPAVSGATSFQVQRRFASSDWQLFTTTTSTVAFDTAPQPMTAYVYRVVARNAAGPMATSAVDVVTAVTFTDDPIIAGSTVIRLSHVVELRNAVNALRATARLAPFAFSSEPASGSPMRASQIAELRAAEFEARQALGLPIAFTDATLGGQTPIRAIHLTELRNGVK